MLELRDITLGDKAWMQPLFEKSSFRSEEYNFTFNYMWREILSFRVMEMDGFLIQKSDNDRPCYLFPPGGGKNIKPVVEAMIEDAKDCGHGFLFYTVLAEQKALLEALFPDKFDYWPIPKYDDYIYEAQKLITLSGKKLHSKRNHINRFMTTYPDWSYEEITPLNMPEVIAMSQEWCKRNSCNSKSLQNECSALHSALDDYFSLGLDGGIIRVGGQVVAFSMGDRLTHDTYLVHVEKAYTEIHGSYAIINQQFAKHNCADYTYINREDDSGDEGLRKAKLSYYPCMRTEKYAARLRHNVNQGG